jgi:thiol-disulfide isomerase/thioredoxin
MKKPIRHTLINLVLGVVLVSFPVLSAYAGDVSEPFMLKTVAGKDQPIQFADYAGKVMLIDFWASWCGPCRQSFPWMNDMQAKYKAQGFEIIAINLDNDTEAANEFLKEVPSSFLLGFDPEGRSAEQMQVEAMPMSYLIDRQGRIRFRLMGFNSDKKAEHEQHIQSLLNEPRR